MKPSIRRRTRLAPAVLEELEAREARVVWEPVIAFDQPVVPEQSEGTMPYEVGPSLMDRERRGHFTIEHAQSWSGALKFSVADDDHQVDFMLDRQHIEWLQEALQQWWIGQVTSNGQPAIHGIP